MNRTFYIPHDKEQTMHDFIKACEDDPTIQSYSARLVELMEAEVKRAKDLKKKR